MKHPGNAANSKLNGEWCKHARPWGKKMTSKIRRNMDKKIIKELIKITNYV